MKTFGWIVASIFGLVVFLSLCFGLTWLGIEWRGFFGPKQAAVERKIFKETRSYNEGMVQQLARYRLQYVQAKEQVEKDAIKSTVRQMFAEYDPSKLPTPELRQFHKECMR